MAFGFLIEHLPNGRQIRLVLLQMLPVKFKKERAAQLQKKREITSHANDEGGVRFQGIAGGPGGLVDQLPCFLGQKATETELMKDIEKGGACNFLAVAEFM